MFEVNYFDPSFRFPRNLRLSLGSDMRLPWGMVGTVDLLYIRGVNQFDITDVNLQPPTARPAGEGGRLLYGTFDEFGNALTQPARPGLRHGGADPELERRPVHQRQRPGRETVRAAGPT